jgi:hypothetical protein
MPVAEVQRPISGRRVAAEAVVQLGHILQHRVAAARVEIESKV